MTSPKAPPPTPRGFTAVLQPPIGATHPRLVYVAEGRAATLTTEDARTAATLLESKVYELRAYADALDAFLSQAASSQGDPP
jgi:hypothetical protein